MVWFGSCVEAAEFLTQLGIPMVAYWWYTYPLKNINQSVGMMKFPTEWKVIKFMFQTTNQLVYIVSFIWFNDVIKAHQSSVYFGPHVMWKTRVSPQLKTNHKSVLGRVWCILYECLTSFWLSSLAQNDPFTPEVSHVAHYHLVMTNIANWKITIFNR